MVLNLKKGINFKAIGFSLETKKKGYLGSYNFLKLK